jgi:WD40 repeat protein
MATAEAETSRDEQVPPGGSVYDGFISYSHAADDLLAPRLQAGLQRFAKPWWKRRALRIFRDESSLSANPHLWSSITAALDGSDWFVLLLSPEAAESPWVDNEVEYWLEHKDPDRIIPVLTDGDFTWRDADFISDAAPPALQGAFSDEPRWVDLRFARSDEQLDLKNPTFSAAVADIASPIRGVPKEELESEEVRQHRRTTRTAWAAGLLVAALAIAALVFGVRADQQAQLAEASRLATASVNVLDDDPELSLLLALASANQGADLGFEQRRALHAAIDRDKSIGTIAHLPPDAWTTDARLSPDGTKVVIGGDARAPLEVHSISDRGSPEFLWRADIPEQWNTVGLFSPDGDVVLVAAFWPDWDKSTPDTPPDASVAGLYMYDAETGALQRRIEAPECASPRYLLFTSPVVPDLVAGTCSATSQWWLLDPYSGETIEIHQDDRPLFGAIPTLDGSLVEILVAGGIEILDRRTGDIYPIEIDPARSSYAAATPPTLSPAGRYVHLGNALFDPRTSEELVTLAGAPESFQGCGYIPAFSADDALLYLGCEDGTVHVFDTASGDEVALLRGHAGWAVFAGFDATGSRLATGSADGYVRLWEFGSRAEVRSIDLGPGYYADSGIDVSGDTGAALLYPSETETLFDPLFSTMKRHAIGEVVVFDLHTGVEARRIGGVAGKVARIAPNGASVVVQSATEEGVGGLRVYDIATGEARIDLEGLCTWRPGEDSSHCAESGLIAADATDLGWSPDGRFVAMSGGVSQRVLVWDTSTQQLEFVSEPSGVFPFSAVVFSPDGSMLAVSSKTGMWIYDTKTWELVNQTFHTGRPSWVMRFTGGGTALVTAQAHSGDVRIYDTVSWEERNLRGGIGQTRDMAISGDETMVALSANDGNIHVLDLETGNIVQLISLDDRDITNIEFIDNDARLLISGSNGPVEVLTLDIDELVAIARSRISRGFRESECSFYELDPCPTLEQLRDS